MTECCDSILWIAIVAFMVPSARPALSEDMEGVCWRNVSIPLHRNISYVQTYKSSERCLYRPWENCNKTESRIAYKTEIKVVWVSKPTCCEGYEKINKGCQPKCSSKCMNGYCDDLGTCTCNFGWVGEFCDEPLLCSIANLDQINYTKTVSKGQVLENFENEIDHSLTGWEKLPKCNPDNSCQADNEDVSSTRSGNTTYYFYHINSSCNTPAAHSTIPKKNGLVVGAVVGTIIFLSMVASYIVYIVRRKRGSSESNVDELLVYDTVDPEQIRNSEVTDQSQISDCGYINPELFHDCDMTSAWQISRCNVVSTEMARDCTNVTPRPSGSRDLVDRKIISDNGYVNFTPISVYDDVHAETTREYDDVNRKPALNYDDVCPQPNREYVNVDVEPVLEYDYVYAHKMVSWGEPSQLMLTSETAPPSRKS